MSGAQRRRQTSRLQQQRTHRAHGAQMMGGGRSNERPSKEAVAPGARRQGADPEASEPFEHLPGESCPDGLELPLRAPDVVLEQGIRLLKLADLRSQTMD